MALNFNLLFALDHNKVPTAPFCKPCTVAWLKVRELCWTINQGNMCGEARCTINDMRIEFFGNDGVVASMISNYWFGELKRAVQHDERSQFKVQWLNAKTLHFLVYFDRKEETGRLLLYQFTHNNWKSFLHKRDIRVTAVSWIQKLLLSILKVPRDLSTLEWRLIPREKA